MHTWKIYSNEQWEFANTRIETSFWYIYWIDYGNGHSISFKFNFKRENANIHVSYQKISNIWIQEIHFEFMPDRYGLIGLIFGLTSKPNLRIVRYNSCLEIQPQLRLPVAVKNVTFLCLAHFIFQLGHPFDELFQFILLFFMYIMILQQFIQLLYWYCFDSAFILAHHCREAWCWCIVCSSKALNWLLRELFSF